MYLEQSATDGAGYPGINDIREMWRERAGKVRKALSDLPREALLAGEGEQTSVFYSITFNLFHDASHIGGGVSMIRKELGHPSASEIVVARMRALEVSPR